MATVNIVPTDEPSVFERLQTLQTSDPPTYNAIVRPNNPPPGVGGYLFDIPGDDEARLKSQITRHYVETASSISDHIAVDPEQVTLRGLVAELVSGIPQPQRQAPTPNILPILPTMSPTPTPGQAQAQAQAQVAQEQQQSAAAVNQSLYQYFSSNFGSTNVNRQTKAFLFWQQMWWGKQLCSVETPWGIFLNMAILDVRAVQKKESRYISDFTVIFEKIRVAGDVTFLPGQLAGRNALQAALVSQNGAAGQVPPTVSQESALYQTFNLGNN